MLNELIEQVDSFFDTVDGRHVGRVAWGRIKREYLELAQQTTNKQGTPCQHTCLHCGGDIGVPSECHNCSDEPW